MSVLRIEYWVASFPHITHSKFYLLHEVRNSRATPNYAALWLNQDMSLSLGISVAWSELRRLKLQETMNHALRGLTSKKYSYTSWTKSAEIFTLSDQTQTGIHLTRTVTVMYKLPANYSVLYCMPQRSNQAVLNIIKKWSENKTVVVTERKISLRVPSESGSSK